MDDTPEDGLGLLVALATAGVGAVYLDGKVEHFPSEPLRGLRLVVLDMFLEPGLSAQQAAQQVVQLLRTVIAVDNGPYVAITWTTSDEAAEEFGHAVLQLPPTQQPLRVLPLSKNSVKVDGNYQVERITERVGEAVKEFLALSVVIDWEQLIHEAASDTTLSLLPDAEDWPTGATGSLAALLRENVTRAQLRATPADEGALRRGLLGALQPIHFDYVEQRSLTTEHPAGAAQKLAEAAQTLTLTDQQVAGLNNSLLLGPIHDGLFPGHIYLMADVDEALAGYEKDAEDLHRFLVEDLFSLPVRGEQKQERFDGKMTAYEAGVTQLQSVVVEVSPSCDMFQGKLHVGRLVAGVLMPVSEVSKALPLPKEPSVKVLGPIRLSSDRGPVHLVLSARYISGCDPAKINNVVPVARLREQAIHDVQAWLSGHGGRLGVLQVRGKAPG